MSQTTYQDGRLIVNFSKGQIREYLNFARTNKALRASFCMAIRDMFPALTEDELMELEGVKPFEKSVAMKAAEAFLNGED